MNGTGARSGTGAGRRTRAGLAAVVLVVVLAGCGNAREDVEAAMRGYHAALLARDFRTACSYNTPEATAKLLASLRVQGIDVASCEDGFAAIYAENGGSAAADRISNTVQIQDVAVDGDTATVNWTAELAGQPRPGKSTLNRVDGQWRFVSE